MAKITFFHAGKELTTTSIKEGSNQTERDQIAGAVLSYIDYHIYDKFTITNDDGENSRSCELTEYFQDSQGRIWKSLKNRKAT